MLKLPVQKAEAISTSLIHQLIHHVLRNEKHQYTRSRDVCILALGFLHGLRACDIACVNFDEVQFWLDACGNDQCSVIVRYGKTTHEESQVYLIDNEGLTFDQVMILREHVNTTSELYQNDVLTRDGMGAKLFVNIMPQTGVIKDHRISNGIVTKMLRQRLTQHFRATDPRPEVILTNSSPATAPTVSREVQSLLQPGMVQLTWSDKHYSDLRTKKHQKSMLILTPYPRGLITKNHIFKHVLRNKKSM